MLELWLLYQNKIMFLSAKTENSTQNKKDFQNQLNI